MSTQNINSPKFPDKSVPNADQSEKAHSSDKTGAVDKTGGANKAGAAYGDQFQISGKKFADEISFARNILSKIDDNRFESLRQIRKNIDQGLYDSGKVREEIGKRIGNDLTYIEAWIAGSEPPADA